MVPSSADESRVHAWLPDLIAGRRDPFVSKLSIGEGDARRVVLQRTIAYNII